MKSLFKTLPAVGPIQRASLLALTGLAGLLAIASPALAQN